MREEATNVHEDAREEKMTPTNVLLQWSVIDRGKRDQRARIPLPSGVGLGYDFDHEQHRWRIVALASAKDLGFRRARTADSAYVCSPLGHLRR